jgi:AcrR family transcriptional regulator
MNKKETILKAALTLFVKQGEQATSMKWIAQEAKCGIGTMYNYFASKEDLINDLYVELKTNLFTAIFKDLDSNSSVKQQFIHAWKKLIDFAISNPLAYRFMEIFSHSPRISEKSRKEIEKLYLPVLEIYDRGKKEGIIKDLNTLHLTTFTYGAISASIINYPKMTEKDRNNFVLMAWDAIKS